MRILKTSEGFYRTKQVDGKEVFIPITQSEYQDLAKAKQTKKALGRAAMNGAAMAGGAATAEVALAGAAEAASVVGTVIEGVTILPTVLTLAAIAGTGVLAWKGYEWLSNNSSVDTSDDQTVVKVGSMAFKVPTA